MPVRKQSFSLEESAAEYVARRAKRLKRSASSVLSEIVIEAARQEARDRALLELGGGVAIDDADVLRWQKALGLK
jgi:hypothetical protein